MEEKTLNNILSVFYYMWNAFSQDECLNNINWHCYNGHIWSKWCHYCSQYGPNGAIAPFIGDLDDRNREALFSRALQLYDGRAERY